MSLQNAIFFDVLADYWDLKYVYEYGFGWDDAVAEKLIAKSSQSVRCLANILDEPIYGKCAFSPWWKHVSGDERRKTQRKVAKRNDHHAGSEQWFQIMYSCCGRHGWIPAKKCMDQPFPYTSCRDCADTGRNNSGGLCEYRRICQMNEAIAIFDELSKAERNNQKRGAFAAGTAHPLYHSTLWKELKKSYSDVLVEEDNSHLKKNTWTRKEMASQDVYGELWDESTYDLFLEMVRFFSCFAPLSALGINFLRHLSVNDTGQTFAKIRNLPPDFGLEQEMIYRVLYSKINHRSIFFNGREYLPVKLFYQDKDINGLSEHLYLDAVSLNEGGCVGEHCCLPLFTGMYLTPGREFRDPMMLSDAVTQTDTFVTCIVDFYYNQETDYLLNRREEGWKNTIQSCETLTESVIFESPYYPGVSKWKTDRVVYCVKEHDMPGFLLFIDSFGEFAHLVSSIDIKEQNHSVESIPDNSTRGRVREYESLLSIYNSQMLADRIKTPLPPREAELEWLSFILESYPNMCQVFLDESVIGNLKEKLANEQTKVGWFQSIHYDYQSRVADFQPRVVNKYRGILTAVREKQVLSYAYRDKPVRILPYALEYDVSRHLIGRKGAPIDIMCYHLDEMRTLNIGYKSILIKGAQKQDEITFSETEKLYHVLAYGIRCAAMDKETVSEKANHVIMGCWQTTTRFNKEDNYIRCIRKHYKNPFKKKAERPAVVYGEKFEKTKQFIEKHGYAEDKNFFERAFGYYYKRAREESECSKAPVERSLDDGMRFSEHRWSYLYLLLSIYSEGYATILKERKTDGGTASAKAELRDALSAVGNQDMWQMICGEDIDGVENEIAFFNEEFQNETVTFVLNEFSAQNVDLIYRLFRNYICVGTLQEDGRLKFTVTYEAFAYRKIHMLLLALNSRIEVEGLTVTAELIKKRLHNKETIRYEK